MEKLEQSALGHATAYPEHYDAGLLFPIGRVDRRAELGLASGDGLPFHGVDVWNAYELSWLEPRGKPRVALAELRVPCDSPRMIESKSLKLYLMSFNNERLDDIELTRRLLNDLGTATGGDVAVRLVPEADFASQQLRPLAGTLIDDQDVAIDCYGPPRPDYLATLHQGSANETLVSHLLKSNCPVTGQPDWGSVQIHYEGAPIDHAGLLRYLVSFRNHGGFHEHCVERIFVDILRRCAPNALSVYARYTRRGGIDINPFRSTNPADTPADGRTARQ